MGRETQQQLIIPMAGQGLRFHESRWSEPKPLIDLGNVRMFELVVLNLMRPAISKLVLVSRAEHKLGQYLHRLELIFPGKIRLVEVNDLTGGPAETVMAGIEALNPDLPVTVANSDQFIFADLAPYFSSLTADSTAGSILVMEDSDPKWSFVTLGPDGLVSELREKEPISNLATIGIYGFRSARLLQKLIEAMKAAKDRTNGEYYVGPAYNYVTESDGLVRAINLGPVKSSCFGLGVPADLEAFLSDPRGKRAVDLASSALGHQIA